MMHVIRKMKQSLLFLSLALLFGPATARANDCSDTNVGDFVRSFYADKERPSRVPSVAELQGGRSGPFSIKLHRRLLSAAKYRDRFIATHPPESAGVGLPPIIYKPPFIEGDMFTGSPDGAPLFEVGNVRRLKKGRWNVRLKSTPDPHMSRWAVAVVVVREDNACAIDDVRYEPLSEGMSLSKSLSTRR